MGIIKPDGKRVLGLIQKIKDRREKRGAPTLTLPVDIDDAISELSLQLVTVLVQRTVEKRNPSAAVMEALADAMEAAAKELRVAIAEKDASDA